ncbi:MAG: septal ring lytic transglycosylase RlpA family protein [Cyanobacteria bacterium P01_E01_bin.42]
MFSLKTSWVTSFLGIVLVSLPSLPLSGRGSRAFASVGNTSSIGQAIALADTSLASGAVLGRSLEYGSGNRTQQAVKVIPWRLASKKVAWEDTSKRTFCPVSTNRTEQWSQLPEVPEVDRPETQLSGLHLRGRLANVVESIFDWSDSETPKGVSFASVEIDPPLSPKPQAPRSQSHLVNVWYSPTFQAREEPDLEAQEYRILIDGKVAIALDDPEQVRLIASRLQGVLTDPDFDPASIRPTILGKYPAAMMGDRLLFILDDSFAIANDENIELLLINWVNSIRTALEVKPLRLAEAQQQMYQITETPREFRGLASWYGPYFHGRLTANGETYDQEAFTAAHPSLPFNTYLKVTNLENQETMIIRINDRGPYIHPRTLDFSRGVARCLQSKESGVVPYRAVIMAEL